jgi:hypothetical protein
MADDTSGAPADLQFDRVVPQGGPAPASAIHAVVCARCRTPIATEYFDLKGHAICGRCRAAIEAHAQAPSGAGPIVTAGLFGLGAGVAGAAIYYAVIAIAHVEIGIVAILIGYMVGRAVRTGAGGRGGRRYQVLAAALTYASVAIAYAPMVVLGAGRLPAGELVRALGLIAALPVIVVFTSLPLGAISGFIIYIGMQQAWRMTAAPRLAIRGPYRVGAPAASALP